MSRTRPTRQTRVDTICPELFDSQMVAILDDEVLEELGRAGGILKPEELIEDVVERRTTVIDGLPGWRRGRALPDRNPIALALDSNARALTVHVRLSLECNGPRR